MKQGETASQIQRQKERDGEFGHLQLFPESAAAEEAVPLPKQVLKAAHLRSSQPISALVRVVSALGSVHPARSGLLERLQSRYICNKQRSKPGGLKHQPNDTTASFWHAAEITRLQMAGKHDAAILLFASKFQWIGLPSWDFFREDCRASLEDNLRIEEHADNTSTSTMLCGNATMKPVRQVRKKLVPTTHVITVILPSILRQI